MNKRGAMIELTKGAGKEEIAAIKKHALLTAPKKRMDARRYCGVIELREDPLLIQQKLRSEWE